MSFASLLSQITKDKKLQEKAKSLSQNAAKPSTSLPKNSNPNKTDKQIKKDSTLKQLNSFSYAHDDDPAVRRLKEARRKEREKIDAEREKKGLKPKAKSSKPSSSSSSTTRKKSSNPSSTERRKSSTKSPTPIPQPPTRSRFKHKPIPVNTKDTTPSGPKLSFEELMKQAESIDKPALAAVPFKSVKKTTKEPSRAYKSLQRSRLQESDKSATPSVFSSRRRRTPDEEPISSNTPSKPKIPTGPRSKFSFDHLPAVPNRPKPMAPPPRPATFAKPNPALLNKLKRKQDVDQSRKQHQRPLYSSSTSHNNNSKSSYDDIDAVNESGEDEYDDGYGYGYEDDYDSEDDGFIVDDEDEDYERMKRKERERQMKSQGYSRDEIWEIFNRGKKRNYYDRDDYDSDDMEATGTEILEDEERTLKQAKLDDLREQRLLEKRAAEKRKLHRQ